MPFPLAHPAAVLPFRRWCPRFLSFPALVVGSLTPDAAYLCSPLRLADVAHEMVGVPLFSLPAGLAAVVILHRFGAWTLPRMPIWLSQPLTPFCGRPLGSPLGLALSVLIGAATHVLWDSFSHSNGWATLHWPLLHQHVATLLGMRVRVCHLLWYGSTPVGVFCLAVAGQRWLHAPGSQHIAASRSHFYRNALGWAALSLPISLAHHLLHGMLEQVFILGFLGLLILGFLFWIRRQEKQPA